MSDATASPRSASSRASLVAAARELFLSKGYAGTTVDEICAHAGLSKGSFYHSFESKEELGLAALDAFFSDGRGKIRSAVELADVDDPRARALRLLDFFEGNGEALWSAGCLMGTFAVELAETQPEVQARVAAMFRGLASAIGGVLVPAVRPDRSSEAGELAEQLLTAIEGGIVLAKAYGDGSRIPAAVRGFRRYYETLI